jgi:uncharacterized membrane protein YjjP (DUF1212 family)
MLLAYNNKIFWVRVMDSNEILNIAAEAGKIMLESGGETYRVEETMTRISLALGIIEAESYATPTILMLSLKDENGNFISTMKRIPRRTLNLDKITKINNLSRNIEKKHLNICDVVNELKTINSKTSYSNSVGILWSAIVAATFIPLFGGGNIFDFVIAFFIGGLIKLSTIFLSNFKVGDFFINIVGGAEAALIAITFHRIFPYVHYDKIIISSIMLLVPGIAITNAIRDAINGDLLSAISRATEALFIAIAIAVGTGIIFKICIVYFGGI